ncbi:MAG TPA: hypothetical protein VFV52_06200 [Bacilli bacterium]|nr:hypothetical protein [Bacilli bacterium]
MNKKLWLLLFTALLAGNMFALDLNQTKLADDPPIWDAPGIGNGNTVSDPGNNPWTSAKP